MPSAVFLADVAPVTSANTTAYVVDKQGNKWFTLLDATDPNGNFGTIEWELNGPGSATFTLPSTSLGPSSIPSKKAEVQMWRNGRCIWWGFIDRTEVDHETVTFQCVGLLKYFDYRYFGKANRDNLLANPSFEVLGLSSWTAHGPTADPAYNVHLDGTPGDPTILGGASARLATDNSGQDSYLQQVVTVTSGGVGELLTLAGWYFITPFIYNGPAFANRGLYLELSDGTSLATNDGDGASHIDDNPVRGSWQRVETTIAMPPNRTLDVVVRLYSPATVIWWDALSLTKMESLSLLGKDMGEIASAIVEYAQDRYVFVHGKTDLRIDAPIVTTGVIRDLTEQFAEHDNVGRRLADFAGLDNGFDYDIETDGTTRTFRVHFPYKGTDRTSSVTITNSMLVEGPMGLRWDGEQYANSVLVIGDGDGPDREEAAAGFFDGNETFEMVVSARPSTPINRLAPQATELLRSALNPSSLTVTMPEPEVLLFDLVVVGDLVTLDLNNGYLRAQGAWRVVAISFDPVTEALTFELNPGATSPTGAIDLPTFPLLNLPGGSTSGSGAGGGVVIGSPGSGGGGSTGGGTSVLPSGPMQHGFFKYGWAPSSDAFGNLVGKTVTHDSTYVDVALGTGAWDSVNSPNGTGLADRLLANPSFTCTVGFNSRGIPGQFDNLALDAWCVEQAQVLVAKGIASQCYVMPFEEMNGDWEPFGRQYDDASHSGWLRMWNRIIPKIRAVYPFPIVWCVSSYSAANWDSGSGDPGYAGLYYPTGANEPDIIAMDMYDWGPRDTLAQLQGHAAFAAAKGKIPAINEYMIVGTSSGHGGVGDDPAFFTTVIPFAAAHNYGYITLFDVTDGDVNTLLEQNPASLAEYEAQWALL